ncbi:alpha/beta hydrolase [Candidatus Gracilibacteria bacterium]|nr:alpha/beta hydrolase [Candidatus Gracilibacteria bacterium]
METNNHNEILEQKTQLKGSYGDKVIAVSHFPVPGNNKVVINIHGTYGSGTGSNNKYLNFSGQLQQDEIANSIMYKSSRVEMEDDANLGKYENKQRKFVGKTFSDELEDAKRVLVDTIKNSQERFGVPPEELEITLNGNSLGGIIAFYLASEFPQIKNISTVGTGFRKEKTNIPILNTFPEADELSKKIKDFSGKFMMHYGSEDNVFTPDSFRELYEGATSAEKSFVHLVGVDHSFGKVGGETSEEPYKHIYSNVSRLVKEGILSSGEDNLLSVVQDHQSTIEHDIDQVLIDKYFVPDNDDNLNLG